MLKGSLGLIALSSLLLSGTAFAQEKIKVGVTATLEGTYTVLGEDGIRGFQTALNVLGKKVGDKELEFVIASTDATPDSAVRAVRKLIEQDKVQILLSPLSGDEGIAVKNFAKTHPELTFINAASGAQETTYVDPAPNFFRYNMDGAQWQVGLGKYAYDEKKYRKIATVGEDYSFIYTQVFGLVLEFCGAGGQVTNRQWVPLGTKDFASVIAALPDDVDAIYLGLGGADAVNFLNQYQQAGGKAHLMGGSIMIDQTILSSKGNAKNALIGTLAASGQADTWENPSWQKFVKDYQDAFPPNKRFPSPSLLATNYYGSTMALIQALPPSQWRSLQQSGQVQGGPCQDRDRRTQRQDQAGLQPPGDRHQLCHRGRRRRQGRAVLKGREGDPGRQPNAGLRSRGVRQDRFAEPHSTGM
ncbi:branched-chain amino acid transport system substrate-binding protein [Bradyrhizobium sp. GM7.3]